MATTTAACFRVSFARGGLDCWVQAAPSHGGSRTLGHGGSSRVLAAEGVVSPSEAEALTLSDALVDELSTVGKETRASVDAVIVGLARDLLARGD